MVGDGDSGKATDKVKKNLEIEEGAKADSQQALEKIAADIEDVMPLLNQFSGILSGPTPNPTVTDI